MIAAHHIGGDPDIGHATEGGDVPIGAGLGGNVKTITAEVGIGGIETIGQDTISFQVNSAPGRDGEIEQRHIRGANAQDARKGGGDGRHGDVAGRVDDWMLVIGITNGVRTVSQAGGPRAVECARRRAPTVGCAVNDGGGRAGIKLGEGFLDASFGESQGCVPDPDSCGLSSDCRAAGRSAGLHSGFAAGAGRAGS